MKPRRGLRRIVVASLGLAAYAAASSPVKVSLRSLWPEVPLVLEVIESVSTEHNEAFFPLLDKLTSTENLPSVHSLTPEAVHQLALQAALSLGYLKEPGVLASVELQLALHAASPKIQASYQFYADRFSGEHNCESWVDWYGERVCDLETLIRLTGQETIDSSNHISSASSFSRPKILSFDHINPFPSRLLEPPQRTAIFYATITSTNFYELHSYLYKLSNERQPRIEYVFRHIPTSDHISKDRSYLSGYGVSLDLKKMDYLALDDRRSTAQANVHEKSSADAVPPDADLVWSLLQAYPENSTLDQNIPLTENELLEIGIQSTQLISHSSNPLRTLTELSQNFPKFATSIARRVLVNESLEEEVHQNQMKAQGGVSMAWLNGYTLQESDMNPFGLLRLLRRERNIMLSLTSLGLSTSQAIDLITHRTVYESQSDTGVLDGLFDASDRPEGGSVIVWWNNLEKDSRYANWSPSITGILRPLYPGQFHNIKANLFNAVLVLDLSQTGSLNFIAGAVNNIINRNLPFRFGIVPIVETEDGKRMARLFYYLIDNLGRAKTMGFISRIAQIHTPLHLLTASIDWEIARSEFNSLLQNYPLAGEKELLSFDDVISGVPEERNSRLEKALSYSVRLEANLASCPTGHAFVNGKHIDMDDDFLRIMQVEIAQQLLHLQEKLYSSELTDAQIEHIDTYFYDLPESSMKRSRYIYPTGQTASLRISNLPDIFSRIGLYPTSDQYLYPTHSDEISLTTYIIADLHSDAGIALMKEAVLSMGNDSLSRLSFIHNPQKNDYELDSRSQYSSMLLHLLANNFLSKISPEDFNKILYLRSETAPESSTQARFSDDSPVHRFLRERRIVIDGGDEESQKQYRFMSRLIARELAVAPGDQVVVVNGRVVGPIDPHSFSASDFKALEAYELRRRVVPVMDALTNISISAEMFDRVTYGNIVSMASSVISAVQLPDPSEQGLFNMNQRPRHRNYRQLNGNFTAFEFGDPSTATYHFGILVDPLSEAAQKWSTLLEWLATIPSVYAEVHLNPARYHEVPLKRFYRYNLSPQLPFDENGFELQAQTVIDGLPSEPIYTLGMDVPPSWLVRPREALHDLDNIQLSTLPIGDRARGVEAAFDLDFLVIEGHARDTVTNLPPRGLQLQLTNIDSSPVADTQVVANLGYLQFRATPGVFQLAIREGRGRDVYTMESVGNEGWNSPNVSEVGIDVTLTSFEGLTLYPRVRRRPGMEQADVLDEFVMSEREPKSFLDDLASRMASIFQTKKDTVTEEKVSVKRQADINIFTVASGLLYERFASIMILSVLRNTKSSVKFWFIENFLSPSFLEFIPHFAEAYGFEYELVTYKWPSWLRAQKEKQRIIWAYKILFLDVLFPMDLKKVIFVDADQIVRADLQELVDLDLHGAPYAYTPMGDDNLEMEGFRFWKTGYWKNFLQGRPYYISALYVVDLVRFRQLAAGDMLRGSYQQLSADPNSLANLDQDLPNNLQREVPIFALHEDWLWCETWCSKDRLHRAKTIDLCQNPLTKEPKLSRARQIPEWEEYDAEIARFARGLADAGVIRSDVAAADANALANAGASADAAAQVDDESGTEASGENAGQTDDARGEDSRTRDEL